MARPGPRRGDLHQSCAESRRSRCRRDRVGRDAHPSLTQLGKHLLTRSDLARLSVPAARILSWLANGWLDQIGALPDGRSGGDPVFTVQTRELRHELASRLATIGKTSVVFTPLRVRSLLLRAMLSERMPQWEEGRATNTADEVEHEPPIELANHLEYSELGVVLQEAIEELSLGTDSVQRIAEEEAALEAAEVGAMTSSEASSGEADPAEPPTDDTTTDDNNEMLPQEEDEEDAAGIYFDSDALVDELESWAGDAAPEVDAAARDPMPEETLNEPQAEPDAPTTQPVSGPRQDGDNVEQSFAPTAAELDALREALATSLADYRNADLAFGQEDIAVELPTQDDFADSIERLSATLHEVQMLANEAAALGDALTAEDPTPKRREVHAPRAETLAGLSMLDDPAEPGAAHGGEEATAETEQHEPTLEALRTAADSIFDQLTMLDEPKSDGPKSSAAARDEIGPDGAASGHAGADVPVEETMVELEALDPRDVLPELEPSEKPEGEEAAMTTEDEPTDGHDLEPARAVAEANAEEVAVPDAAEESLPAPVDSEQVDTGQVDAEQIHANAIDDPAGEVDEATAVDTAAAADIDVAPRSDALAEPVVEPTPEAEPETAAPVEPTVEMTPVAATAMPALEVQTFLTELRESLVELARQPVPPAPPATDFAPLVTAVREGFERSHQELSQTNVAIGSLVSCVGDLGKRLSHRLTAAPAGAVQAALALPHSAAATSSRSTWVLLSVCLLIMCWSAVLWWKTGDVRLSVGTLLGANAVACCLLVGRGR